MPSSKFSRKNRLIPTPPVCIKPPPPPPPSGGRTAGAGITIFPGGPPYSGELLATADDATHSGENVTFNWVGPGDPDQNPFVTPSDGTLSVRGFAPAQVPGTYHGHAIFEWPDAFLIDVPVDYTIS